jgi:hypothetical protein
MEAMRSTWTDSRLDDFKDRVDSRFDSVEARLDKLDDRFDKLQHIMVQGFVAMAGTMVIGFLTLATLLVATRG